MAKLDLMQFAATQVPEGETALGAVKANWNGMVPPTPVSSGGLAGLSKGEMIAKPDAAGPPDPAVIVSFPSARQMAIVLTEFRLLIWSLGFSGKPKDYIGDVPLGAVVDVKFGGGGYGDIVRISMASGAEVDIEIMRGEPAEEFVETMTGRLPPRR